MEISKHKILGWLLLSLILLGGARPVWANGGGAFLESGFGSRPLGMGKACTAVAGNADAVYWNPAGLADIKQAEFTSMYTKMWGDVSTTYLAYAHGLDQYGSVGISYIRSAIDGIPKTDNFGTLLGYINYSDQALLLAYGKPVWENLSLGSTVKIVAQTLADKSNTGLDIDLAGKLTLAPTLSAALKIENALEGSLGPDKFDRNFKVGAAYRPLSTLLLAADLNANKKRAYLNYGLEWAILPIFTIRAGVADSRFATGIGLSVDGFAFDYSYSYHELGDINTFSLSAHL